MCHSLAGSARGQTLSHRWDTAPGSWGWEETPVLELCLVLGGKLRQGVPGPIAAWTSRSSRPQRRVLMLKAKRDPQGEDKHEDKDKEWPFEAPNPVAPALPMLALAELCGQDTGVTEAGVAAPWLPPSFPR